MSVKAISSSPLVALPRPLALTMSDFLDVEDAVSVALTCRDLNQKIKSHDARWVQVAQTRTVPILPGKIAYGQIVECFYRTQAYARGATKGPKFYVLIADCLRTPAQVMTVLAFCRIFTAENWYESYLEGMVGLYGAICTPAFDMYFDNIRNGWTRNKLPRSSKTHLFFCSQLAFVILGVGVAMNYRITGISYILSGSFGLAHCVLPPASFAKKCSKICGRAFVIQDRAARTPLCKRVTRALSTLATPVVFIAKFARNLLWCKAKTA